MPTFEPMMVKCLSEAFVLIMRELQGNDILQERLLGQPHTQKVDLGSLPQSCNRLCNYGLAGRGWRTRRRQRVQCDKRRDFCHFSNQRVWSAFGAVVRALRSG